MTGGSGTVVVYDTTTAAGGCAGTIAPSVRRLFDRAAPPASPDGSGMTVHANGQGLAEWLDNSLGDPDAFDIEDRVAISYEIPAGTTEVHLSGTIVGNSRPGSVPASPSGPDITYGWQLYRGTQEVADFAWSPAGLTLIASGTATGPCNIDTELQVLDLTLAVVPGFLSLLLINTGTEGAWDNGGASSIASRGSAETNNGSQVIVTFGDNTGDLKLDDACVFDSFNRVVAAPNWGPPSSNPTYDWTMYGSTATVSIDGQFGVAAATSSTYLSAVYQGDDGSNADVMFRNGPINMEVQFKFSTTIDAFEYLQIRFAVTRNFGDDDRSVGLYLTNDPDDPPLLSLYEAGVGSVDFVLAESPPADTAITLKWSFVPGAESRAKIWWTGSEPDWMAIQAASAVPADLWSRFTIGTSQSYTSTWQFDYIEFSAGVAAADPVLVYGR